MQVDINYQLLFLKIIKGAFIKAFTVGMIYAINIYSINHFF